MIPRIEVKLAYWLCGASIMICSSKTTGITPNPTKEDSSISFYDDEKALPLFHHRNTVGLFLGERGFGAERAQVSLISHATLDPYIMAWSDDEGEYDTQIIDLVGILKAPNPRVYATMQDLYARDEMPGEDAPPPRPPEVMKRELKKLEVPTLPLESIPRSDNDQKRDQEWKVRPLDEFEAMALRQLQAGHELVWKDQGDSFRAFGAIRMQATCAHCHEDKNNGELLGAFTYFGFKRPRPAEEDRMFEHKLAELATQEPFSKEFVEARNNHRSPDDSRELEDWPVPQHQIFFIDRDLANKGIVTLGMLQRQKDLLARLPRDRDAEEQPANAK